MSIAAAVAGLRTPFKGLTPFDDSPVDARLFFGRERETEIVAANLLAARLTVLYGPSGVGKSSLLRAGVAQALRRLADAEPPAVAIVSSWSGEPLVALEETARTGVADALGADPGDAPGDVADRLDAWTAALGGELCLVLDQLEEFFLYHGDGPAGRAFRGQLAELVTRPRLRVNVLLGIRDDALARLDAFKEEIPGLFGNALRLDRLDRHAARSAILGPLGRYNELAPEGDRVSIEPELVDAVLDEVTAGRIDAGLAGRGALEGSAASGGVETPYLQLVLQRLWEVERERGSGVLRRSTFAELGGAQRIVEDHLERAMAALTGPQRDVAAGMFDHLVTPSGTKIAHGLSDLATYARVGEGELSPVLDALARQRIVRPLGEDAGGERYEIFHDVLADAVLAWRARHEAESALERERAAARRRQRRLAAVAGAALAALAVMAVLTTYAFSQRSTARQQAALAQDERLRAEAAARRADVLRERADDARATAVTARRDADRQRAAAVENALRAEAQRRIATREAKRAETERIAAEASERHAVSAAAAADAATKDAEAQAEAARVAEADATQQRDAARVARSRAQQAAARADREAGRARAARRVAEAGELTARAAALLATDPERGLATAVAAARAGHPPALEAVLREALRAQRSTAILPAGGPVRGVAFAGSGSRAAVASGSDLRVFDVRSGRRLRVLRVGAPVGALAVSADGTLAAVAGENGATVLWDLRSGTRLREVRQGGALRAVALSADGRLLATGGAGQHVRVWDAGSGRLLHDLAHPVAIRSVSFSDDASLLLTVAGDARVFDVASGVRLALLDQRGRLTSGRFDAAGRRVVTGGEDDVATIWDARTGTALHVLEGHSANVLDVAFSPDGTRVATAGADAGLRLWDADSGALVTVLSGQRNDVTRVAFSGDGASLAAASADRSGRVWSGGDLGLSAPLLGHRGTVRHIAFAGDGTRILTGADDGSARLWRTQVDPPLAVVDRSPRPLYAVATGPGGAVATGGADGVVRVRRDGRVVATLRHPAAVADVAFVGADRLLTASEDGRARLWRLDRSDLVRTFEHGAPLRSAAVDRAARLVVTAGADGVARLWSFASGEPLRGVDHGSPLGGAALSPDGRLVATAGADKVARIWRTADGRLVRTLVGHGDDVTSVAFSPDGSALVTASRDADARVWDVATGDRKLLLRGHQSIVGDAEFSPDGRWIVTAGPVTAALWNAATGDQLFFLRGHGPRVRSAAFDGAGRWVFTVGDDGTLRTYRCALCARSPELLRLAERRLAALRALLAPAERQRYLGP